ncbi:MAG: hypothetical protein CSA96_06680 [Bacteroidetes bacterium]|nr:MAG: hypothetical protein CSA96_06680 [Bacteroidota bacterium]
MADDRPKLSRSELEEACLRQNIIIQRKDPLTGSSINLPNIEKVNKMIREFDILVDGASRGKSVNEISKIERFLYEHEDDPEKQSEYLASCYSKASMYIEAQRSLLNDKHSENWKYLFVSYFKLEDIYYYFNKGISASVFFKDFTLYKDMVELTYHVKLMNYLRSQVQLQILPEAEKDLPSPIEDVNLKLAIIHLLGISDLLTKRSTQQGLAGLARFFTVIFGEDPASWRSLLKKLEQIGSGSDKDILNELNLCKAKEIISVFGIDLEKD